MCAGCTSKRTSQMECINIERKCPITLVYKAPALLGNVSFTHEGADVIKLTFEIAIYHAERVKVLDVRTLPQVVKVFPQLDWNDICQRTNAVKHIVGLIDMSYKLNTKVCWEHPEAFLHPTEVLALADVIIDMAKN